jgi:hypothetical protein
MPTKGTSGSLRRSLTQLKRYVIALNLLATIVVGTLTLALYYRSNELQARIVELQDQNQRLQNMIYNYAPKLLAYPKYELLCDLNPKPGQPNGLMRLFVVIVTPHNGYAVVNQTFFHLSYDFYSRDFLDANALKDNTVSMYRETVFAVPAGSFQTTLEIAFSCQIRLAFKWLQPGHAIDFPVGSVGIRVTFYDAQANLTYANDTAASVRVVYSTISFPSG